MQQLSALPHYQDILSSFRGRLTLDAPLGALTWFRAGGKASVLARPADVASLSDLVKIARQHEIPLNVVGVGSNLIIRDGGVSGIVVKLTGAAFTQITVSGDQVIAGAGALDRTVAEVCCTHSLTGLEFLVGIPGTMGAGVRMNAGAYGTEMRDILESVEVIDDTGGLRRLSPEDCGFAYRESALPPSWIVTRVFCAAKQADQEQIAATMMGYLKQREQTQPTRARTGGSTFKNPAAHKAWELIDQAGCRGLVRGDAQMSELHCNFMLNRGNATAADLEGLGEEVRRRVKESTGVGLDWEIKRMGGLHP